VNPEYDMINQLNVVVGDFPKEIHREGLMRAVESPTTTATTSFSKSSFA
jgi:hypothetical protein